MTYGMNGWNKTNERAKTHARDCISRQAAIDATWEEPSYTDPLNVLTEVRDRIEALPSAQPDKGYSDGFADGYKQGLKDARPERLTDDDFETIRIHLNAYKEKLCNQGRWEEAEEYQRLIERFMSFASEHQEVKK